MSSPLVNQFRKGGISRDVRLTAASGALPLKPSDQVELLFLLTRDADGEVEESARKSLLAQSVEDLTAVLKDPSLPPDVLSFFGEYSDSEDVRQVVIRNATTPDATIARMVSQLSQVTLEFVVVNQTRLLRHPPILEALEGNENLSSDQKRRIDELKHDFKLGEHAAKAKPPPPPPPPPKVDLSTGPAEEDEPPPSSIEEAAELYGVNEAVNGEEASEEDKRSIFERIVKMTVAEKMVEGLKGPREARMMLIRDRNRTVWSSVLASPKMNEADAEAIAQMRNVAPDVLREVGKKREWTKRYKVAHELVKNPKTPPEVSSQLLTRLSSRDLKQLTRDRNVSEVIRRQATKLSKKNT